MHFKLVVYSAGTWYSEDDRKKAIYFIRQYRSGKTNASLIYRDFNGPGMRNNPAQL
jgi:hypothetical protein